MTTFDACYVALAEDLDCTARLPRRGTGQVGPPPIDPQEARAMGLLSGLMKAGIAKKAIDEARKPKNQAKARELLNKVRGRDKGPGSTPPR